MLKRIKKIAQEKPLLKIKQKKKIIKNDLTYKDLNAQAFKVSLDNLNSFYSSNKRE